MDSEGQPLEFYRELISWMDAGRRFALAVILEADGSTPRKAGVKALIDGAGAIRGTVGGGALEAEVQRRAVEACAVGQPAVVDIELGGEGAGGDMPICGGSVRVLVDPAAARSRSSYAALLEALERRERGVLVTFVAPGPAGVAVWIPEKEIDLHRDLPGADELRGCLAREAARSFRATAPDEIVKTEILVEPILPRPILLVAGGGHVGQALVRQAALVGFDIAVIDDRAEFTAPSLFPEGTRTICGEIAREIASFPIGGDTYIVIVTRGHTHDVAALGACIHSKAAYVGMIGSRRKVALVREEFLTSGRATAAEFDRVFTPIGVDIGALTVPEIAASIVAQLIAVRRTGGEHARAANGLRMR